MAVTHDTLHVGAAASSSQELNGSHGTISGNETEAGIVAVELEPHERASGAPPASMPAPMRNFYIIASGYLIFTFTDAALRMIVLFGLYQRRYQPFEIALMFTSYEALGVVTNLFGGIMGSRWGLRLCILGGLACQLVGISLLFALLRADEDGWSRGAVIGYVIFAQCFAGVAKDLVKLAGKSVTKLVTKSEDENTRAAAAHSPLFRLVAWLTGAKNSIKGLGFFAGAALLNYAGVWPSLLVLAIFCLLVIPGCLRLDHDLGRSKTAGRLTLRKIFDKGYAVNMLSLARMFLFGSRDLWFEVVLPIYLRAMFNWSFTASGAFLAVWIVIYGAVQTATPEYILKPLKCYPLRRGKLLVPWTAALLTITIGLASFLTAFRDTPYGEGSTGMLIGLAAFLIVFAFFFAVNSSMHSYLIVAYAGKDKVAINVGFYYCANAMGRLVGTLLSGWLFQYQGGIWVCLWTSCGFLIVCAVVSVFLPDTDHALAGKV
ncbi:major facilitator superfamily domain-containing protein [Fimicolochytrium jonesii]|uniref:major facilitator superfamily domain-containing protein n=1 Tax=Fimicolochytrium jonesii TaxID=1396493 RepID=UPI0022FDC9AF|nr:major facilitator superfamily domain-containing protein [Fimicolochytrium jonesii]KAI8824773.1 major facilitator superfamily domain-containing protein [Fimicolochytrium jonesii]